MGMEDRAHTTDEGPQCLSSGAIWSSLLCAFVSHRLLRFQAQAEPIARGEDSLPCGVLPLEVLVLFWVAAGGVVEFWVAAILGAQNVRDVEVHDRAMHNRLKRDFVEHI
ncbi:hypothetical protein E2562_039072 [Oryza meyeriana var. granulata]|uniref:Uncharacterized protein n=1 Tax=Oryza meyeriana var. granulata TaxID=110450 RepID=A0A6G1BS19_9ORYZ|nr:hypothetical protein E2562_039072 [Oryza meyeriana var. granulata]